MSHEITLSDVMCRIQQAQTVLSFWLQMLTTDDGKVPDMVEAVLTILDGLPDAVAVAMEAVE
ncbi:prophage protein [Erwinia piriflorinigrans]|uniref:prophage protein n=1 Tax=Erwinia piriflorinigrans TaxID=665097 RepID=UPI0006612565|nr:prophage protein [Erwinia piriflorinigrans]